MPLLIKVIIFFIKICEQARLIKLVYFHVSGQNSSYFNRNVSILEKYIYYQKAVKVIEEVNNDICFFI